MINRKQGEGEGQDNENQGQSRDLDKDAVTLFEVKGVERMVSCVGSLVSTAFLLVHVAIFACFPALRRSSQSRCLLSFTCSLVLFQTLHAAAVLITTDSRLTIDTLD
jgi:hypothetical protein